MSTCESEEDFIDRLFRDLSPPSEVASHPPQPPQPSYPQHHYGPTEEESFQLLQATESWLQQASDGAESVSSSPTSSTSGSAPSTPIFSMHLLPASSDASQNPFCNTQWSTDGFNQQQPNDNFVKQEELSSGRLPTLEEYWQHQRDEQQQSQFPLVQPLQGRIKCEPAPTPSPSPFEFGGSQMMANSLQHPHEDRDEDKPVRLSKEKLKAMVRRGETKGIEAKRKYPCYIEGEDSMVYMNDCPS